MIKFENVTVRGFEDAVNCMYRNNPFYSESDSYKTTIDDPETLESATYEYFVGENDLKKIMYSAPINYCRLITVTMDICAPISWWFSISDNGYFSGRCTCGYMDIIAHKFEVEPETIKDRFTVDDFNCKNLNREQIGILKDKIAGLNGQLDDISNFITYKENATKTVITDYETLSHIYPRDFFFKADDDKTTFREWIHTLPYSELITSRKNF